MLLIELERDQCLWTAFYQLNEKDQEIIYRRVFFNTPLREIAGKLQLNRKKVLQRYENGLLILRWNFHRLYTAAPKNTHSGRAGAGGA